MWQYLLPKHEQTVKNRSLAFRLLSGTGCWVAESIGRRSQTDPVKFSRVCINAEEAAKIEAEPKCLRIDSTLEFIDAFFVQTRRPQL